MSQTAAVQSARACLPDSQSEVILLRANILLKKIYHTPAQLQSSAPAPDGPREMAVFSELISKVTALHTYAALPVSLMVLDNKALCN